MVVVDWRWWASGSGCRVVVERAVAGEMAVVVVVAVTTAAVAKEPVVARAVERAVDWAVAVARAEAA